MSSQQQLRVGIVGCGYQGTLMAQAIAKSDILGVAACVDPIREAADRVARRAGHNNVYASIDELLRQDDVDAVVIATPHHVLRETSLAAIRAKKHVLAEKPIATNEREAAEIEQAVMDTGIRYMAGYSLRFFAAQRQMHNLIAAGAVGEIQAITAGIGMQPLTGWQATRETGGGQLLYLGSHLVDAILGILQDEPREVYADIRYRADTGTDETATFQIRFAGGTVAQCLVTQAVEEWFDYVNIYGRDGRINLTSSYWLQYTIAVASRVLEAYTQPTSICPRLTDDPIMMMLVPEVEEFGRAILEDRQPMVTIADGRRVLKILDAALKSAQAHTAVQLD